MANHLFNQLNQTSQTNPIKGLYNQARMSQNPVQFLMQSNPATQQIINEIQTSGLSAQQLFYKKVQEQGIDPSSILNQLR